MQGRNILVICAMWIALPLYSQEDTIKLPYSIAQRIAIDLEELDRVTEILQVNTLLISNLKLQNNNLEQQNEERTRQIELLQLNTKILEGQFKAEQLKKKNGGWFIWLLASVAAFGSGYVLGSL
jgi:hypothetical protein